MPFSATLIALAIAFGATLTIANAVVVERVPWQFALKLSVLASIAAMVGGRLVGLAMLLFDPAGFVWPQGADWITPWYGFRAPGAVMGVIGCYILVAWFHRALTLRMADAAATASGVGVVVARAGCSLTGCCRPLAEWYIGLGLVMIAVGLYVQRNKPYDGAVASVVLFVYALGAAVLEPFRAAMVWWGPLPQLEWLALVLLAAALLLARLTSPKRLQA